MFDLEKPQVILAWGFFVVASARTTVESPRCGAKRRGEAIGARVEGSVSRIARSR